MKTASTFKKILVVALASVFLTTTIQMPVMAAMVDNNQLATQAQLQVQRDEVRSFVAREDIRDAMVGYGVSTADVDARINNLTESELLKIQERISQLPAGGSGVLEAIVVVILIFVLLDLLGATDVFPNV
ncbi:MAG: PA2779 family protein [Pseudomonadota bacterium]